VKIWSVLKTAQLKKNADCTYWPEVSPYHYKFSISYIYNHFGNLAHITVLGKNALLDCIILKNKNITRENYRHWRTANLTNSAKISS